MSSPKPVSLRSRPYLTLDAWRGAACLMVVANHILVSFPETRSFLNNPLFWPLKMGWLGVPLFFVISGYCILRAAAASLSSERPLHSFAAARVRRILPPYWAALLLTIGTAGAEKLLHHGAMQSVSETHLQHAGPAFYLQNFTFTNFLFGQPLLLVVAWTLCYEAAFYILTGLLLSFSRRGGEEKLLLSAHCLTLLSLLRLLVAPHLHVWPFDLWPQFGFGAALYDLHRHSASLRPKITLALCGAATAALAVWGGMKGKDLLGFVMAFAFTMALMALYPSDVRLSESRILRPLRRIGLFSYSLYITHLLVLGAVHHVLEGRLHGHNSLYFLAVFPAVGFAYMFHLAFERPFLSSGRRQIKLQELLEKGRSAAPLLPEKETETGMINARNNELSPSSSL